MSKWAIEITDFNGGFAPLWSDQDDATFGNKNQASYMYGVDLFTPGRVSPGYSPTTLTNGTEAGAVTTSLKGMTAGTTASIVYGVGGAKLYKIDGSSVTNAGSWPHTIDKGSVTTEAGEDVIVYQSNLYYTYNHSGSAGDIGKYDLSSTFDDDWGSTVPTGKAALQSAPHPMVVGGNDILYFGNGRYIGDYNGTTIDMQALDFPSGYEVQDLEWYNDKLYATVSRSNESSVFIWDGTSDTWETEIKLKDQSGALYAHDGILFVCHGDGTNQALLSYITGSTIADISTLQSSDVPTFYQVTSFRGFLILQDDSQVLAYGSPHPQIPPYLFGMANTQLGTESGIFNGWGTLYSSSNDGSDYDLSSLTELSASGALSYWQSLNFLPSGDFTNVKVDSIRIDFTTLANDASVVTWALLHKNGTAIATDTISYAKLGAVSSVWVPVGKLAERFSFKWTNTTTASGGIALLGVRIYGHTE